MSEPLEDLKRVAADMHATASTEHPYGSGWSTWAVNQHLTRYAESIEKAVAVLALDEGEVLTKKQKSMILVNLLGGTQKKIQKRMRDRRAEFDKAALGTPKWHQASGRLHGLEEAVALLEECRDDVVHE